MFKLSSSCNHTRLKSLSPLSNYFVDDALIQLIPFVQVPRFGLWVTLRSINVFTHLLTKWNEIESWPWACDGRQLVEWRRWYARVHRWPVSDHCLDWFDLCLGQLTNLWPLSARTRDPPPRSNEYWTRPPTSSIAMKSCPGTPLTSPLYRIKPSDWTVRSYDVTHHKSVNNKIHVQTNTEAVQCLSKK